jgi:hypothetical protein
LSTSFHGIPITSKLEDQDAKSVNYVVAQSVNYVMALYNSYPGHPAREGSQ